jgi:hypothetical protein
MGKVYFRFNMQTVRNCILVFSCSPAVFTAGIFFGEKTKIISEKTAKKVSVNKIILLPL